MRKLKSTSDIIRATGSVREPYLADDTQTIEWLNSLPTNRDLDDTDIGVYVTVQGSMTLQQSGGSISLFFPHFEILRKFNDKNGNPCLSVRDTHGFNTDNSNAWESFNEARWIYFYPADHEIVLSEIDPTA